MPNLQDVTDAMRAFTDERDWARFHDPKSLVLALVGEVGELAEQVQWLPADQATSLLQEAGRSAAVRDEIADVLLYLLRLADVLDIDVVDAASDKLQRNISRYPAAEVRGRAPRRGR